MIQDIYPHKLKNEYDPSKTPKPESIVMAFHGNDVLLKAEDGVIEYPRVKDFPAWKDAATPEEAAEAAGSALQYLFTVDDDEFYLLKGGESGFSTDDKRQLPVEPDEGTETEPDESLPEGFSFLKAMSLRSRDYSPKHLIFAEFTAHQLARWYNDNRFCGTCGAPTGHSKTERAMVCTKCRRTIYPRILPAVIVALKSADGERLLLTKYANRPFSNYALIAGFTEIGETLEETVAREVMEEVGLKVKNIRYYKSQPWAVADDILMGFYCDVDGDETISLDHNELKLGAWFTREEVVLQDTDFSLTNEMMTEFKEGRR